MSFLTPAEADWALNGLGDSLRIGPQEAPPAARGTPIIQRGPHGMRFAPLPSEAEKGVRFWRESEVASGFVNQQWDPMPSITSVMGLGELREPSDEEKARFTNQAEKNLASAIDLVAPLTRGDDRAKAQAIVLKARIKNLHELLSNSLAWESSSSLKFWTASFKSRAEVKGINDRARNLLLQAERKLAPGTITASGEVRRDGEGYMRHLPSAIEERGKELMEGKLCTKEQLRVPIVGTLMCRREGEPRLAFKYPWVTFGILGLVALGIATPVVKALGQRAAGLVAKNNPRRRRSRRRR